MDVNVAATPYFLKALKLHKQFFNQFYSYPIKLGIRDHKFLLSVKTPLWQVKFLPFLINEILTTFLIGFGSCVFLVLLELFHPQKKYSRV